MIYMEQEAALVDQAFLLERFPGKGGWTYTVIPQVLKDKSSAFGWVKVKGSIDAYVFNNYRLMPLKGGALFLPVKAAIRKAIGKEAGDYVHVVLYPDYAPTAIPEDLLLCLQDAPIAFERFRGCTDGEQKMIIDWIYAAKRQATRDERMARLINGLETGVKEFVRKS